MPSQNSDNYCYFLPQILLLFLKTAAAAVIDGGEKRERKREKNKYQKNTAEKITGLISWKKSWLLKKVFEVQTNKEAAARTTVSNASQHSTERERKKKIYFKFRIICFCFHHVESLDGKVVHSAVVEANKWMPNKLDYLIHGIWWVVCREYKSRPRAFAEEKT